ncbi:MAG: hypothetical protein QW567_02905, partial [Candidatus Hadarchaeales archaeon]
MITKPGVAVRTARFPVTFLCLWTAWIAFTASLDAQELLIGALASLAISAFSYRLLFRRGILEKLQLRRLAYLIAYIPAYVWAEI